MLTERIRTSAPADLELMFTSECGIGLNQTDGSFDNDFALARAIARVYVDGRPVPVVAGPGDTPPGDLGSVDLCNRLFNDVKNQPGVPFEQEIDQGQSANGFNWVKLDVGNGLHTVEVRVQLAEFGLGSGTNATAFIGRRTLTSSRPTWTWARTRRRPASKPRTVGRRLRAGPLPARPGVVRGVKLGARHL